MDFKNCKTLTLPELEKYKEELTSEYSKLKKKVEKLCDNISEVNDEYIEAEEEINKRKSFLENESEC